MWPLIGSMILMVACSAEGADGTAVVSSVDSAPSVTATESSLPAPTSSTSSLPVPSGLVLITENVDSRAREFGLVSPGGEYVGPVDTDGNPLLFEPIAGFGDFSDYDPFEEGDRPVNDAVFACVRAQGFPVQQTGSGGVDFSGVTEEQNQIAFAVLIACKVGLNEPPPEPLNVEQLTEVYAYRLELADCVSGRGYDVGDPPSLDRFLEGGGVWSPYPSFSGEGPAAIASLERACPQSPPGGYGSWDPGDPVVPEG